MWKNILGILQDNSVYESWSDVLALIPEASKTVFNGLHNFICMQAVHAIMKFENERNTSNLPFCKENFYHRQNFIIYRESLEYKQTLKA